jgi:Mg/Co/Ni transporter MgtE
MVDSLLVMTKGRAFWLAVAFLVAVLMHVAVGALTGMQEPIGLLAALFIPVYLVVALAYTLGKRLLHR